MPPETLKNADAYQTSAGWWKGQNEQAKTMDEKNLLTALGTVLVILGVAVWGVYAVVRWGLGWDVTGREFLPYHLAGVVPGMILRRRRFFLGIIRRLFS
ncbi:MAG: hypothetical protein JW883_15700 [Deltaproteobacteria bacterium]|nr:hypothetical protein [Deltaproteobacteria bacterium]